MNYFELFQIPVTLRVDKSGLSQKFFAIQKKYHPDFFSNATPDEQEEALEMSALANKALKTFQNPDSTIKYALQLKGLLEEEEKYQLAASFLMEVMELNELKMDDADDETVQQRKDQLQIEIYEAIRPIIENYEDGITPENDLLKVKEYYYMKKYLDRL
ncbi:MAG: iron-sulfur cluster co-chaperone HscB C-terminal domain-containing protein [Chitinophagaceae bacterium]